MGSNKIGINRVSVFRLSSQLAHQAGAYRQRLVPVQSGAAGRADQSVDPLRHVGCVQRIAGTGVDICTPHGGLSGAKPVPAGANQLVQMASDQRKIFCGFSRNFWFTVLGSGTE